MIHSTFKLLRVTAWGTAPEPRLAKANLPGPRTSRDLPLHKRKESENINNSAEQPTYLVGDISGRGSDVELLIVVARVDQVEGCGFRGPYVVKPGARASLLDIESDCFWGLWEALGREAIMGMGG